MFKWFLNNESSLRSHEGGGTIHKFEKCSLLAGLLGDLLGSGFLGFGGSLLGDGLLGDFLGGSLLGGYFLTDCFLCYN